MATGLISTAQPAANATPGIPDMTGAITQTPSTTAPVATPANVASVAAPTQNTAREIASNETVAGHMNNLLSADSPYLQSARNRAMETANGRGLINSSIAAGAGERAAIDASLPIAQQDATTYATAGQSAQNANQDLKLTGYKSLLDSAQANENFGYQTKENEQNIKANTALQDARLASEAKLQTQAEQSQLTRQTQAEQQQGKLQTQAEAAQLKQQTQQQQATQLLQTTLKQMDINLDLTKLDNQTRDAFTAATAPIIQQVQAEISQIQRMPDAQMPQVAKAAAIDNQNAYLRANIETISTLYGYKVDWPSTPSATEQYNNGMKAAFEQQMKQWQASQAAQIQLQQMTSHSDLGY